MPDVEGGSSLERVIPNEPLACVKDVYASMGETRNELERAGLPQFIPFADVYRAVTGDVGNRIGDFKEPTALNVAAGIFYNHYIKQHRKHLGGKSEEIEPHWRVFYTDERVYEVDRSTLLLMGMAAHIGGDLGRTVAEADAPKDYVEHDYPMVNQILWQRAHAESKQYVPSFGSRRIRATLTNAAMLGIVSGRRLALRDYHRIKNAKSDGEASEVVHLAHQRTARVVQGILANGHKVNRLLPVVRRVT